MYNNGKKGGIKLKIWIGILLSIIAVMDHKTKKIPLIGLFGLMAFGLCIWFVKLKHPLVHIIFPLVCGILSRKTDQLGFGDVILLFDLCFFMKFDEYFGMVFFSFFLTGIWSMFLLFVRHKDRRMKVAYVPFLCISYWIVMLC